MPKRLRLDIGKMCGHKATCVAVSDFPMRNVSKVWPARLLAAVTALALVLACTIGAYAHAARHGRHAEAQPAAGGDAGQHAGHHAPASDAPTLGHVDGGLDRGDTGHSYPDCCDTICHGGQAILAAATVVPHPALCVPLVQSAAALDGAKPGGLERPPKALLPA